MPELKFTKSTDQEHEVKLDSYLISAMWSEGFAFAGRAAKLEVRTSFVGNGAKIKIQGKSKNGESLGKIDDEIRNNLYVGELAIPEDIDLPDEIYFQVSLSKNGLDGESNRIPVFPVPRLKQIGWSVKEARRGDVVTLSAEVENIDDNTEVKLVIYEYDQDSAHDRITELPATVRGGRIELDWEYEYHEDTDEIATEEERQRYGSTYNPPEYFFTILFGEIELGREQESQLLLFKDWVEIKLRNQTGQPVPNEDYVLVLPDGTERTGTLDENGLAVEKDVPPGRCDIRFPNL